MSETETITLTSETPAAYVGTRMEAAFKNYIAELSEIARRAEESFQKISEIREKRDPEETLSVYYLYRDDQREFALSMVHASMVNILTRLVPLLGPNWDRLPDDVNSVRRAYKTITALLEKDLPGDPYDLRMVFSDLCSLVLAKHSDIL